MSCNNPIKILKNNQFIFVPCGRCMGCISERLQILSSRAEYESQHCKHATFLTLTYTDEFVPISDFCKENFPLSDPSNRDLIFHSDMSHSAFTLKRCHFRNFVNSLKNYLRDNKYPDFRFLGSGEYGGMFNRPHYHLALYGLDFCCLDLFSRFWPYGLFKALPLKNGSSRYICKYLEKQRENNDFADLHYLERPFITFSKGFGSGLYLDHSSEIAFDGKVHYGNKTVKVPMYYKNKYFNRNSSFQSRQSAIDLYLNSELPSQARQFGFKDVESYLDWRSKINESSLVSKARSNGVALPLEVEHRQESALFHESVFKIIPSVQDALEVT